VDFLYEEAIFYLTKIQLYLSKYFLQIFHYKIAIIGKTIKIIPSDGVHLDRGCLGRNTLGVFAIFILAFPGKFIQKIWFIIVGTAIFILMNVSRIVALAITDYCCPQHLNFNHHFLFKIIIYAVILLLWAWWINRYSMLKNKK
jgi:exosortase/archaeosortase family protein